jgi:hypothetical protein
MTAAIRDPRPADTVSAGAIWFGLLGAPAAWSLHELTAFAVVAHSCFPRETPLAAPGVGAPWATALAVIVVTLIIALLSLLTALRSWRATAPDETQGGDDWSAALVQSSKAHAARYLAFSGILLASIFTAMIVYSGIAMLMLPICSY